MKTREEKRSKQTNYMKKIVLFMFVFGILNIFGQTFNPSDIDFTISLEKDTFFIDEPLNLEIKETNISERKINISNGPYNQIFKLNFISEDGIEYKWWIGVAVDYFGAIWDAISYTELQPGESQYYVINLLDGFGKFVDYKGVRGKSLPMGTYKMTVTHRAMESWKEDFGKTYSEKIIPIISNTLTFTVKTPYGYDEEERQAYCAAIWQFYKEHDSQNLNIYLNDYINSQNYYKYDILSIPISFSFKKGYDIDKERHPERYQFDLSLEQMVSEIANSNESYFINSYLRKHLDDSKKGQEVVDIEQYNRIKEKVTSDKLDSKLSKYYRMEIKKIKNYKTY